MRIKEDYFWTCAHMHRPETGRRNCAKTGICTVKMWKGHWLGSECVEKL